MKQLTPYGLLCLFYCHFLGVFATDLVVITPSERPPTSASKAVVNNFVSLSIAIHFFQDYARTGSQGESPNTFSRNLLSSLKESTSIAPEIRIGGTSADRTTYIPSQNTTISTVTGGNGIPLNVTLNQQWFERSFDQANFPDGTKFIFDLPLVRNDSLALNNTILGAQWALEAIGKDRLDAFEIGNEEDLYVSQQVVPANWTVADYAARWKIFSTAVTEQVLIPYGLDTTQKWFQGLVFAGLGANKAWTTETAFNANVDSNNSLKSVSLHNYPAGTAPWVNLGNTFMNHNAIVANLTQVDDDIAFLQSSPSTQEIAFNLGETNIDFTNLNMDQFEGVLGSALWTVDYILYGASQNINRMYLHQGTTFGYAAWQPIATNTSQPKVRSPWYGLKFAAEAIGSHQGPIQIVPLDFVVQSLPSNSTNSSSSSGVDTNANITTPTATAINANTTNPTATGTNPSGTTSSADPHQLLTSEKISAYGIYESSSLARIALINLNEWNATTPYPRPTALFKLALPRAGSASANGDVSARSAKKCTLRRANTGNGSEDANENEGDNGNDQGQGSGKVTIRKLTAPGGASADSDLTFGGIMWNYTTQGLPQRVQGVPGTVEVDRLLQDGSVLIELGASEALLIDVA